MRRTGAAVLLGILCLLTACAAEPSDGRSDTREMTFSVEGQEETETVALWEEAAYSMYLPAEGWTQDEAGVWHPAANSSVSLYVEEYESSDEGDVWEVATERYPSFSFTPVEEGRFTGYDSGRRETLWVRLAEREEGCFALCARYPTAAAEGFGARLQQLGETFEAA